MQKVDVAFPQVEGPIAQLVERLAGSHKGLSGVRLPVSCLPRSSEAAEVMCCRVSALSGCRAPVRFDGLQSRCGAGERDVCLHTDQLQHYEGRTGMLIPSRRRQRMEPGTLRMAIAAVAISGAAILAGACSQGHSSGATATDSGTEEASAFIYRANPFGGSGAQVPTGVAAATGTSSSSRDFTPVVPNNLPPSEEWTLHGPGAAVAFDYPASQMQITETVVDVASPSQYLFDAIGPPSATPGCTATSGGGQDCHYYPFQATTLKDGTSAMVTTDGGTTVVWFAPLRNASPSATSGMTNPVLMMQLNAPASSQISANQAVSYANAFASGG